MTSRRSRLKAVTNLPVRRKALTPQCSANENTLVENVTPQKTHSSVEKSEFPSVPNSKKEHLSLEKEVAQNDKVLPDNCAETQTEEKCLVEKVINIANEVEILGKIKNTIGPTPNSTVSKTDSSNSSFINRKYFKTNLISTSGEKAEFPAVEENDVKIAVNEQSCTSGKNISTYNINNNNNNNNSNDIEKNNKDNNDRTSSNYDSYCEISSGSNVILEDGNKCFTVLTTQNVALPLSEYTITPLTPCDNTYSSPNVSDEYPTQDYEEVHIYASIEDNELYVNEESIVETIPSEPILIKISNSNEENEINKMHINFRNSESNYIEPSNTNLKPDLKSKTANFKSNFSQRTENYRRSFQRKDIHSFKNSVSTDSYGSPQVHLKKQYKSITKRKRPKCNEFTKKLADAKKEFQKKYEKTKPDRSTLKMIDLIFYNPATNPMESKNKFEKKDGLDSPSEKINTMLEEEKVDEPDAVDSYTNSQTLDNCEPENMNKMPVPQVKIGLDGEIILDEKSIVIETTDAKKGREELLNSAPIFEDRGSRVSYYRAKSRKSRDWTDFETKRFYKALNTIGPDFSLMQKYFPKRSRLELKNKFKREEKLNRNLIDKALNNPSEFDMTELEKDLAIEKEAEEDEVEMKLCGITKTSTRKPRIKSSVLSREMIESDGDSDSSKSKSSDTNSKRLIESDKNKKKIEFDFVLEKLLMKE